LREEGCQGCAGWWRLLLFFGVRLGLRGGLLLVCSCVCSRRCGLFLGGLLLLFWVCAASPLSCLVGGGFFVLLVVVRRFLGLLVFLRCSWSYNTCARGF